MALVFPHKTRASTRSIKPLVLKNNTAVFVEGYKNKTNILNTNTKYKLIFSNFFDLLSMYVRSFGYTLDFYLISEMGILPTVTKPLKVTNNKTIQSFSGVNSGQTPQAYYSPLYIVCEIYVIGITTQITTVEIYSYSTYTIQNPPLSSLINKGTSTILTAIADLKSTFLRSSSGIVTDLMYIEGFKDSTNVLQPTTSYTLVVENLWDVCTEYLKSLDSTLTVASIDGFIIMPFGDPLPLYLVQFNRSTQPEYRFNFTTIEQSNASPISTTSFDITDSDGFPYHVQLKSSFTYSVG